MTLLGILILLQTPSLHLGGPDAAIPRRDVDQRTIAPLIRGVRPVSFPSDPTGIGECATVHGPTTREPDPFSTCPSSRACAGRTAGRPASARRR